MSIKNFAQRMQDLGQKAAQVKQAIASVPPKIAEVREAVLTTTGQWQQLRNEVQSTVTSLRTDDHNQLGQSLQEIDGSTEVFREAGYALADVEMELGIVQRLVVHLEKIEDVDHDSIKVLIAENTHRKVTHAILTSLIKAEELSDGVNLTHLDYHKLTVYVGPAPCVRLCWTTDSEPEPVRATISAQVVATPSPAPSAFSQTSFFEQRTPAPIPAVAGSDNTSTAPALVSIKQPATQATPASAPVQTGDWRRDALARFKKMPDLSKRL